MEFRRKPNHTKVRKKTVCSRFGGTGSQFSADFFQQISCPIIGRKKKNAKSAEICLAKKSETSMPSSVPWTLPYLLGWHMWSGGTCLGNPLGNSCGLGNGQCNHPLPWSGPMFIFESSMERGFNLSIPFPRPLINTQIHPNSWNHVKAC